jgi:hypothetical protein
MNLGLVVTESNVWRAVFRVTLKEGLEGPEEWLTIGRSLETPDAISTVACLAAHVLVPAGDRATDKHPPGRRGTVIEKLADVPRSFRTYNPQPLRRTGKTPERPAKCSRIPNS